MKALRCSSSRPFKGVETIEQHAGDDVELGFPGLVRHGAAPGADLGGIAEQFLEFIGGEGDLAGVEFGGLAGEELHGVTVGVGHTPNGQLGVFGVDVALEAVERLVEMIVRVVDPVPELGRRSCSRHDTPSKPKTVRCRIYQNRFRFNPSPSRGVKRAHAPWTTPTRWRLQRRTG